MRVQVSAKVVGSFILFGLALMWFPTTSRAQENAGGGVETRQDPAAAEDPRQIQAETVIEAGVAKSMFFRDVSSPTLHPGAEWVLQIDQRGGFAGVHEQFVLDSSGNVTCTEALESCPTTIPAPALDTLSRQIRESVEFDWTSRVHTLCSDCLHRMLILRIRNPDDSISDYLAYWNLVPSAGAAALYGTASTLLSPSPRRAG